MKLTAGSSMVRQKTGARPVCIRFSTKLARLTSRKLLGVIAGLSLAKLKNLMQNRKMILSALARHDYAAAHLAFSKMSETGRNDRTTRYLMYKVGLQNGEADFGKACIPYSTVLTSAVAECLDLVCRQSAQDATLLYACAVEAKNSGNKKEAIAALEMVLDKYDHAAPADIHLPTLLR